MIFNCAIFDFDGTLFDSMPVWKNLGENYLKTLGITAKKSLNESLRTMSLSQGADFLKAEYSLDFSQKQIISGILKLIEDSYFYKILPKPGVLDFLCNLEQKRVKMCIATASDKTLVSAALKRCKMEHFFCHIFSCNDFENGKDSPEIFRAAMNFCDSDRNSTIVFEDSLHAIKTAKNDNFITAAIFDENEPNQKELQELSSFYIKSFDLAQKILF